MISLPIVTFLVLDPADIVKQPTAFVQRALLWNNAKACRSLSCGRRREQECRCTTARAWRLSFRYDRERGSILSKEKRRHSCFPGYVPRQPPHSYGKYRQRLFPVWPSVFRGKRGDAWEILRIGNCFNRQVTVEQCSAFDCW